ncbi:MAG: FAD-dependent oxidoreductase [Verrucomicrobiota bacterium JB022]|nr:FAD-dependent oxidoreductase [Verrucomicrobiota bacterium JB022]
MTKTSFDLIVYGGTSAAVIAAYEGSRQGLDVLLVSPENRLGGLTTGGLGDTDIGIERAIGGLSRHFYERVARKYGQPEGPCWRFEPRVALEVFEDMIAEAGFPVLKGERLVWDGGVEKNGGRIERIRLESGKAFSARQFIDATYEGDLMAQAGVSFTYGREPNALHGETLNGIHAGNELPVGIDPYVVPGDPSSGLLERVFPDAAGQAGDGDDRIQAYNFRMCLTDVPGNRVAIAQPEGYREADYEILFRAIEKGQTRRFFKLARVPGGKTDSNNDSGISTDYIGMNRRYPFLDYAQRDQVRLAHERYQRGLVWTLQNHPRVPQAVREFYSPWGLPQDEFLDNAHWPSQLYVREARRMLGEFLITEPVVRRKVEVRDCVGLGSYAMDSHHIQYCVDENGHVRTEGGFYITLDSPYCISLRATLPKRAECLNLQVPVCVSATHAAYGSVRMEPVFMILGQSAGAAAALAVRSQKDLLDLDYPQLARLLEEGGQRLDPVEFNGEAIGNITD